jgi:hypothetical protein
MLTDGSVRPVRMPCSHAKRTVVNRPRSNLSWRWMAGASRSRLEAAEKPPKSEQHLHTVHTELPHARMPRVLLLMKLSIQKGKRRQEERAAERYDTVRAVTFNPTRGKLYLVHSQLQQERCASAQRHE